MRAPHQGAPARLLDRQGLAVALAAPILPFPVEADAEDAAHRDVGGGHGQPQPRCGQHDARGAQRHAERPHRVQPGDAAADHDDQPPAEQERAQAEAARDRAELARADAEDQRSLAEGARSQAESARDDAEKKRAQAEGLRDQAETHRRVSFNAMSASQASMAMAEQERAQAEQERKTAELARAEAETKREAAERERKAADESRQAAAESQQKAFEARQGSETAREKALLTTEYSIEHNRIMTESQRALTFEVRVFNSRVLEAPRLEHVQFTGSTSLETNLLTPSVNFALTKNANYAGVVHYSVGQTPSGTGVMSVAEEGMGFATASSSQLIARFSDANLAIELSKGRSNTVVFRFVLVPTDLQPGFKAKLDALDAKYRKLGLAI